jgi:transglutaminase-like putative cysteine protease
MTRLSIVHRTGFTYDEPATASYNEVRLLPHTGGEQFVLQTHLAIHPGAVQDGYVDYWGTRVSTFEVLTPHKELSVTASSLVEVPDRLRPAGGATWEELAAARSSTVRFVELSQQSEATRPPVEVETLAAAIREEGMPVHETALRIAQEIGGAMEYVPGVTGVNSTAVEAWQQHKGVCQDIAHITLGALRSAGIPARYVSGYLHPRPDAAVGETVAGESHAWVEWYAGGWHGYDPTNSIEIGDRHVHVARGRDYNDVPPLRGVYSGTTGSEMFVSVEITRVA